MDDMAFVLMPFAPKFDAVYDCIQTILNDYNVICNRADHLHRPTNVIADVVAGIDKSTIVVADLTEQRANVFYELAIAHAFNKPTVMISQSCSELPFDLQNYRVVAYENSEGGLAKLKEELAEYIASFRGGSFGLSNPIVDYLDLSPFRSVYRTRDVGIAESKAKGRVCVIAPDIALGPYALGKIMKINLARGVRYQYLMPADLGVEEEFKGFIDTLKLGESIVNIYGRLIDPDFVESDVTIIDPGTPDEVGFIMAPSERPEFHFRVVGGNLYRVKQRFSRLWHKAVKIS